MSERPPPPPASEAAGLLGPAPALLDDLDVPRRRDLIRMRLFGEAPEAPRVGRFVPLQRLGSGGMGVVYAAYDEQLERKVALKVLLPSRREQDAGGRDRLLREAQALARLSHPNVVTVYEAGVSEERVFIAMELVRGQTLRAWRTAAPRSVREVVAAYVQAGRGLAAAHDQGIVHKDFKPDNVMVGDDGRVRVLDFGLARDAQAEEGAARASPAFPSGTPAYMAPEQREGGGVDSRADQFSFCVALHEALYGARPVQQEDGEGLRRLASTESRSPPPAQVPGWLRAVLARGLKAAPAERWPSMHALLAALARDPGATLRRRLAAAGLVAFVSASTWMVSWAVQRRERPCERGPGRMLEVWGPRERAGVEQALSESGLWYAAGLAPRIDGRLDDYVSSWSNAYRDACLAHRSGEQSDELFDLRMACLEARRQELGSLVKVLQEKNAEVVEHAVQATQALGPLEPCSDAKRLRSEAALVPSTPEVARVRERLAAARADEMAGLYERSIQTAGAVAGFATAFPPLEAEAQLQVGSARLRLWDVSGAGLVLENAFWGALASRSDRLAARAATKLLELHGYRLDASPAAAVWERLAEAMVERLQDPQLRAELLNNRGLARVKREEYPEAKRDYEEAISIAEVLYGPGHRQVALTLGNLAQIPYLQGDYREALRLMRQTWAIDEKLLGTDHPSLAPDLSNLGLVLLDLGEQEESLGYLRRALLIKEKAFGPDSPNLASALNNVGIALLDGARYREALDHLGRARQVSGKPPRSLRLAVTYHFLGRTLLALGRASEARVALDQALALRTQLLQARDPLVGETLSALADVLRGQGRRAEAAELYLKALAILEQGRDPRHPEVAYPLTGLGRVRLEEGNPEAAVPLLERAVDIRVTRGGPRIERARSRFLLARALATSVPDRAGELAEAALRDLDSIGPGADPERAELRGWLRRHRSQ